VPLDVVSRHDWPLLLRPLAGYAWYGTETYLYGVSPTDLDLLRVTDCNRNESGLHSARFSDHILCLYRPPQDHIICI
jgi:hypothetical protein